MCDAVFIGNTTYDLLATIEPSLEGAGGYRLPKWAFSYGGKAANAAAYFARSGGKAAYIGTVGADFDEIGYSAYFEWLEVDVSDVISTTKRTPLYVAFNRGEDEYTFFGEVERLPITDEALRSHWKRAMQSRSPWVVYFALADLSIVLYLVISARSAGIRIAWNPILRDVVDPLAAEILQQIDYLFVNEYEAAKLSCALDCGLEKIQSLNEMTCISITRGDYGTDLITSQGTRTIPPVQVAEPLDTTGAGDAYAGAFLTWAKILGPENLSTCAVKANEVASAVVRQLGAQIRK